MAAKLTIDERGAMDTCYIVGISGVTNAGKTSMANFFHQTLNVNQVFILNQDSYIKLDDSRLCIKCGERFMGSKSCVSKKKKKHCQEFHDWENSSVFDMAKFREDIENHLRNYSVAASNDEGLKKVKKVLIIEGFTVFEDKKIVSLCTLKIFLTLNRGECKLRRSKRSYQPEDPDRYFGKCVWPAYQKYFQEVKLKVSDLVFIDGGSQLENVHERALKILKSYRI